MSKPKIIAKQFKLPLEEDDLNYVYNKNNVIILDEKVFPDKSGDVVVFLKYEDHGAETTTSTKIPSDTLLDF